jgi:methylmalonyl-CoA mutase N-terminal domain/subunit
MFSCLIFVRSVAHSFFFDRTFSDVHACSHCNRRRNRLHTERPKEVFSYLDDLGNGSILEGVFAGIDSGYFMGEIAQAAYDLERKLNDGRHIVVGVNDFLEGNDDAAPETLQIGPQFEEKQLARLAEVKRLRDGEAVARSLAEVRRVAGHPTINTMPAIIEAVRVYATVGEIMNTFADEFGRYRETPVI